MLLQRFFVSEYSITLYTSQIGCPVDGMHLIPQMLVESIFIHEIPVTVAAMELFDVSWRIRMLLECFAVSEAFVAFFTVKVVLT
ncbi:hypothetical protein [Streptomyces actuosus]|uniref:hypothetical protein n=1 Tax=Streptomyces actuosus TaxID=1885 RepID=UPI001F053841|nr:hypothetical protein [Streptomyces actuosus]